MFLDAVSVSPGEMAEIERTCVFGGVLVEVEEHSQVYRQAPSELDVHHDTKHDVDQH
jgi:hypothetical protein